MMKADLDQFFTREVIAEDCWRELQSELTRHTGGTKKFLFIEPAAGGGAFYDLLPSTRRLGIDIAPQRREFLHADFLKPMVWECPWQYHDLLPTSRRLGMGIAPRRHDFSCADFPEPIDWNRPRQQTIVIGNPPFGRRGKMALAFFARAAQMADIIAFIVPVIFRKYFIHKQMPDGWRWIYSKQLPRDAFQTPDGKPVAVNTEFQVWTRHQISDKDMRLFAPPPIHHNDFKMWQYNNTPDALKMFNENFEFAVPSQGWQDYTRRETDPRKCEKHKQWMLFAPTNKKARKRLYDEIDYAQLATRNTTSIPGFRKGDIVQEYMHKYG